MSIYYSGTFKRSSGAISAIMKQLKLVNLKPVKKIEVKFDPFHPNAVTARDFLFHISAPKVTNTNLNCSIKVDVVNDRSAPEVKIDLLEKRSIKFIADNLNVLEILQGFNKHISSKVPIEEPVDSQKTKIARKKQKQGR